MKGLPVGAVQLAQEAEDRECQAWGVEEKCRRDAETRVAEKADGACRTSPILKEGQKADIKGGQLD